MAEIDEYVPAAEQAVNAALAADGYVGTPGTLQVKRWMRQCPDQDWTSPLARQYNTEDVVAKARSWAKKNLPCREKPEPSMPKELTWTGVGVAYATASKVQALAEGIRREFWGTSEAPFKASPGGLKAALQWLEQAQKEDEQTLEGKRPGRVQVSLTLDTDDAPGLLMALEALHFGDQTQDPKERLRTVIDALGDLKASVAAWQSKGGFEGHHPYRTLELAGADRWSKPLSVFSGTRLAALSEKVDEVVQLSGWWSAMEALTFIMCSFIPPAAVQVSVRQGRGAGREIALRVRAPTTVKELAEVYRRTLANNRLNPQALSRTYQAVLGLYHETPHLSWPERYQRWLELCDAHPELPRLTGPDALRVTCKRALKRASW